MKKRQFKIDNEYILSLKPCADRHKNYLQHYRNTSFSVVEFLKLDKITYDDKLWVWKRFAEKADAVQLAIACAESVLPIFQRKYPDDNRPQKAIEAARKWLEEQTEENLFAAAYAASDAYAAANDARAAYAHAAHAHAAHSAHAAYAYAANAAAAAADAVYANYAAHAAADAAENREAQENFNLKLLIEIYERKELVT